MGVGGANELRHDITLVSHSCGRYTQIAGIRNIPVRLWQIFRMFVATKRVLRHDVDLIRTISIVPTIVALMARGRRNVPILANVSDFYSDIYSGSKLPFSRIAVWVIRRMERVCARTDYLIVDTSAQRDRWMDRGVQPTKCVVIPHGLPRSWAGIVPATTPEASHGTESPTSRMLFYVGDISAMDGVDVLMEAVHHLSVRGVPVRLLIIGKGTGTYLRELHRLMWSLSIDDLVEHIASVRNDELPAIIDRVSVCVAPFRLQETSSTSIPNKVLEYLVGSKPIVVPAGSALQHIFGSAFSYFTPGDPVSLAQAIETALATQLQTLGLRTGIQRAMQWPSLMGQEWELIDFILTRQVGDARRFDYRLSERLIDGAVAG
jgi:glycosyltransferase involved in cell wall biosynthesis